jgi:hypothetical protein
LPKDQAKAGAPAQLAAVAVAANSTALPAVPPAGTVAEQERAQGTVWVFV